MLMNDLPVAPVNKFKCGWVNAPLAYLLLSCLICVLVDRTYIGDFAAIIAQQYAPAPSM